MMDGLIHGYLIAAAAVMGLGLLFIWRLRSLRAQARRALAKAHELAAGGEHRDALMAYVVADAGWTPVHEHGRPGVIVERIELLEKLWGELGELLDSEGISVDRRPILEAAGELKAIFSEPRNFWWRQGWMKPRPWWRYYAVARRLGVYRQQARMEIIRHIEPWRQ